MQTKLISSHQNGIALTFIFEKPIGFSYKPGQYVYLTLPRLDKIDPRGPVRQFTLSSSPTEKHLAITTKISPSGYKLALARLKKEDIVDIDGPHGVFYLQNPNKSHLFVSAGLGLTPFRSMLKSLKENPKQRITLLHCAKRLEDIPFLSEFEKWHSKDIVNFITHLTKKDKRINADTLKPFIPHYQYWVSGPPSFVDTVVGQLEKLGAKSENIQEDKFTGYTGLS